MLTYMQNDVMIKIEVATEEQEDGFEAMVRPATDQQRHDLGRAAVGQAWMAWSPTGGELKTIKFMPPKAMKEDTQHELLKSYRFAIRVAEAHEVNTLALPLPERAGLERPEGALESELLRTLLAQCNALHHLRYLRLLASGEQEAVRYANRLVEERDWHVRSS